MSNIIRLKAVLQMTGLSKSSVYLMMINGGFPKNILLGERAVGWVEEEIRNWIDWRVLKSRS